MRSSTLGAALPYSVKQRKESLPSGAIVDQQGFLLGTPALVCRWRLWERSLPLANRHVRALRLRRVQGELVPAALAAWVKASVEEALAQGSERYPHGVLMLVIDKDGKAALTVGPYEPLKGQTLSALARRAAGAATEGHTTGVVPEALWIVRDGTLVSGIDEGCHASGASGFVEDLAKTLGIPWSRENHLAQELVNHPSQVAFDEAFLVSDEHGILCARDASGPRAAHFAEAYQRLLQRQNRRR